MSKLDLIKKMDSYYQDLCILEKVPPKWKLKVGAIISYVVWGTSFLEYFGYRFWNKTITKKREYMTRRHMFRFFDTYCSKEFRNRIGDKSVTKQYYGKFMERNQFDCEEGYEAFLEFCKCHPNIFIKKKVGWGGENARYEFVANEDKCQEIWETLDASYLVEERLQNCSEIKNIHPNSLNTMKVTTLLVEGKPEIQFAIIRFGNNTQVDNVHLGGIYAGINIESGIIDTMAMDKHFRQYKRHPITQKEILGFNIPKWEDVKRLVTEAAMITPQLCYSSWDVAVTEGGVMLIEGNWDAEFYPEQVLYGRGHKKMLIEKLEKTNGKFMD